MNRLYLALVGVSKDDILAVLREHPEIIIEALERRPDLLLSLILRVAPWDRVATKEDIKLVIDVMEKRFEDMRHYFDKTIETMNRRFEDVNRRFEELERYVDRRVASVERLIYAFNIPILILLISLAIKAFLA